MEKFGQYKGIFYNNKATHRYYEGGAHFSYLALVKKLMEIKNDSNQSNNTSRLDASSRQKEHKILKEIKKVDMLILSRQKNQSTGCLLENYKKVKADEIYNKIMNDQLDIEKNNKMKILQKVKNLENDKFSKMKDRINKKHFNSSVYNVQSVVNIPLLFSQNKRNKNSIITNNPNIELKKIRYLGNSESRHKNMNSTIGFNEDNKYFKYYIMNNLDIKPNPPYTKNVNSSSSNSTSVKKSNNIISSNKFDIINKLKNKNNSLSKNRDNNKMNISIFNFSKLKYPNKFIINKASNKI